MTCYNALVIKKLKQVETVRVSNTFFQNYNKLLKPWAKLVDMSL